MINYLAGSLILFVGAIYLITGVCLWFIDGRPGLCIAYVAYAIANVGLYLETLMLYFHY